MKKLLIGLVLLGPYVFAEPMPEGSRQAALTNVIVEEVIGLEPTQCPPEQDPQGVQVACLDYVYDNPLRLLDFWDFKLNFTQDGLTERPEFQSFRLIPQSDNWTYHADSRRYERSYDLHGGLYRVIVTPGDIYGAKVTIFYTQ
jgi:hypothetical protein